MFFTARTAPGQQVTLREPVPVTQDPRLASADFTRDELLCFAADDAPGGLLPAGSSWRIAGRRSMARHGASALDTELVVRLLLPQDCDEDPDPLLSQAMMQVALALAGSGTSVVDDRYTGTL